MEVAELCTKSKCHPTSSYRPQTSPCTASVKGCSRRYIQPPRTPSYAPKNIHIPPSLPFNANTTYHNSYLNTSPHYIRAKSIRPMSILQIAKDKFQDDTTNKLSYQPVWEIVKAKPFIPARRKFSIQGPTQNITTVRNDFGPKYVEKPGIVLPTGNIRLCSGPMENRTTSGMSFIDPGFIRPPLSFKPSWKYSPSDELTANETTHMLSYRPFCVKKRELHPWARKPLYKVPEVAIDAHTTYSKSYMEMGIPIKAKPILPISDGEWLRGNGKFYDETCYSNAYIPRDFQTKCIPVVPPGNIGLSNKKMSSDTTNKLSYQAVRTEKRIPFRPKQKNMISGISRHLTTTNQSDYYLKTVQRPEIIIPCGNIQHSNKPLDGSTTTALSYMNHGFILPPSSFKPSAKYDKSSSKLDADTINKLSYQSWTLAPKEIFPWATKPEYQRPKEPMAGDSIYNMSFAPPGHYIEECKNIDCPDVINYHNSEIPKVYLSNDCPHQ